MAGFYTRVPNSKAGLQKVRQSKGILTRLKAVTIASAYF